MRPAPRPTRLHFAIADEPGRTRWASASITQLVWSHDSKSSAAFLAEMLGLPAPTKWGPFQVVATVNGVNVDFKETEREIHPQHYAFLVSEVEFDEIFGRIRQQGRKYIIHAVAALARQLQMETVAEGVETLDHLNTVAMAGCEVQGFYFSEPVPAGEVDGVLARVPKQLA